MTAVATIPLRFNNILYNREFTKSGAAVATVRIRGSPWRVAVDNYLPYDKYNYVPRLEFSRGAEDEGWVQFLEKLWAKTNGNYDNIVSGDTLEAIEWLTGFPSFSYPLDYPTEEVKDWVAVWNLIVREIYKKSLLSFSTANGEGNN